MPFIWTDDTGTPHKIGHVYYGVNEVTKVYAGPYLVHEIIITTPVGEMFMFAGSTPPTGSFLCNGGQYSKTTYPELYAAIGDRWNNTGGNSNPNAGNFRVPLSNYSGNAMFKQSIPVISIGGYGNSSNKVHNHGGSTDSKGGHSHAQLYYWQAVFDGTVSSTSETFNSPQENVRTSSSAGGHGHTITINAEGSTQGSPEALTFLQCVWHD